MAFFMSYLSYSHSKITETSHRNFNQKILTYVKKKKKKMKISFDIKS